MQRTKSAREMTVNDVVEIYNLYLRTLKDELNVSDYRDAMRKIIVAQMGLAEMQRTNVPLNQIIETMRRYVHLILVDLHTDYMYLPFSMNSSIEKMKECLKASPEELHQRLTLFQLQGYPYNAILNAICSVLLYPVDDTLFNQFVERFSKVADKHPIFTSSEKQDIRKRLKGMADLKDIYTEDEDELQSIHDLIDSLPGLPQDEQLKLLQAKLRELENFDIKSIEDECRKMLITISLAVEVNGREKRRYDQSDFSGKLGYIISHKEFTRLSTPDQFCVISARRILNAANGVMMMKRVLAMLDRGIKASEPVFIGSLRGMANPRSSFPQDDWDLMEKVILARDKQQMAATLSTLSLPELKMLRKSFNHPQVLKLIDSVPSMQKHREEKYLRKRQVIQGYEIGRPGQHDVESRSVMKKMDKGKYKRGK